MTGADRARFSALMAMLAVAFDLALTEQRIKIYEEALRGERIEALEWAAKEAVRTLKFFPRAAELRELTGGAPKPVRAAVGRGAEVVLLEELTPPEVAKIGRAHV